MMAPTLMSDWSLFSATHVGVAHFSEGYCTYTDVSVLSTSVYMFLSNDIADHNAKSSAVHELLLWGIYTPSTLSIYTMSPSTWRKRNNILYFFRAITLLFAFQIWFVLSETDVRGRADNKEVFIQQSSVIRVD